MGLLQKESSKIAPEADADRCGLRRARRGGRSVPAVSARRLRHRPALRRHGGGRGRGAGALGDAADLFLRPGAVARGCLRGAAERSDRQARQGASGSVYGYRHAADAGAAARRRGASPRRALARVARRDDRLERAGQEPRRPRARAAVGGGGRARRLHDRASDERRGHRSPALLLSQQPDRQSARHHHRGSVSRVRRRAGTSSESESAAWCTAAASCPSRPDAGCTAGRCGRSRRSTSSNHRSRGSTASITTPSCTRSRSSSSWSSSVGSARVLLGSDYPYDMGTGECVRQVKALSIAEADKAKLLCDNALALLGVS